MSQKFKLILSYVGVGFAVVTVSKFVMFVSYLPGDTATPNPVQASDGDYWEVVWKTCWVILRNLAFLCSFMFMHSILADKSAKEFYARYGLQDIERSIYVMITCYFLQVLMYFWQPIPWIAMWNLNINTSRWMWWTYTVLHSYIWLLIYTGNLMLDASEFLGIKQVEYCNRGLPSPDSYKSASLKRLHIHMHHTSFLGFSILFWVYPFMSLDRIILAVIVQLYMFINWKTNSDDLKYLRNQLIEKEHHVH